MFAARCAHSLFPHILPELSCSIRTYKQHKILVELKYAVKESKQILTSFTVRGKGYT